MNTSPRPHDSHLFLLRLWAESEKESEQLGGQLGEQVLQWHGRVQHIISGETHNFLTWPMLIDLLLEMLPPPIRNGNEL
jgi:hypothetical protein